MGKNIDFSLFLTEHGENGYVRKVIAVRENENQVPWHYYGTVSESQYFNGKETTSVYCENDDCFIIKDILTNKFEQRMAIYFLVIVDFKEKNSLRLLNSTCRTNFDPEFPYPENVFVESLIKMGLFKPEAN